MMNNVELGQLAFHSNKIKSYDCPSFVEDFLETIETNMINEGIINDNDGWDNNPFRNTGNVEGFKNDVFEVHAFDWGEEPKYDFNFKWKDLEINWYKYLGRGMTMNKQEIQTEELLQMLKECLNSIKSNND